MKTSVTKTYDITFSVESHWNEPGGMGHDQFGSDVQEMNQALTQLDLARATRSDMDWKIVLDVKTSTK